LVLFDSIIILAFFVICSSYKGGQLYKYSANEEKIELDSDMEFHCKKKKKDVKGGVEKWDRWQVSCPEELRCICGKREYKTNPIFT